VFGSRADITRSNIVLDTNSFIAMPHARRTFQRFWDSINPRPQAEILRDYLLGTLDTAGFTPSPAITGLEKVGNDVAINFTTSTGGSYSLESATNLSKPVWTHLLGPIPGSGNILQTVVPAPVGQPNCFYRLAVQEP